MKHAVTLVLFVLTLAVVSGCSSQESSNDDSVSGVISEVTGDVSSITGFVVLSDDATSHKFIPEEGLLFYGAPLSHLREHVVTGERVVVTFERGADGEHIATLIEHE